MPVTAPMGRRRTVASAEGGEAAEGAPRRRRDRRGRVQGGLGLRVSTQSRTARRSPAGRFDSGASYRTGCRGAPLAALQIRDDGPRSLDEDVVRGRTLASTSTHPPSTQVLPRDEGRTIVTTGRQTLLPAGGRATFRSKALVLLGTIVILSSMFALMASRPGMALGAGGGAERPGPLHRRCPCVRHGWVGLHRDRTAFDRRDRVVTDYAGRAGWPA